MPKERQTQDRMGERLCDRFDTPPPLPSSPLPPLPILISRPRPRGAFQSPFPPSSAPAPTALCSGV